MAVLRDLFDGHVAEPDDVDGQPLGRAMQDLHHFRIRSSVLDGVVASQVARTPETLNPK